MQLPLDKLSAEYEEGQRQQHRPAPLSQQHEVLRCPACGSASWVEIGTIPAASIFAGQALLEPIRGGSLLKCRNCHLNWRSLVCAPKFYETLYAQAEGDEWQSHEPRRDHQMIAAALTRHMDAGDVLDIGCGNGALLDLLPAGFRRFGIEIGKEARVAAVSRGVELVGEFFNDILEIPSTFDAILACDVIEHAFDPLTFVNNAMSRLRPGGLLILSTGNANAWLWRTLGTRFWYSQFAEHLTFLTPRWLAESQERGTKLIGLEPFAYRKLSVRARLKTMLLLAFYVAAPAGYGRWAAYRRRWKGSAPYYPNPPGNGLTKDHLVATLRRVDSA